MTAQAAVEVKVYAGAASLLLRIAYQLAYVIGPRSAERLANLAVHWLLWSRTAGRWERVGKNVTVTMWEEGD